jgi:hypothetical protein
MQMKLLSIVSLLAIVLLMAGCADPLEERSTDEVGAQLERGVTGKGKLGPIDRPPGDPAAQRVPEE